MARPDLSSGWAALSTVPLGEIASAVVRRGHQSLRPKFEAAHPSREQLRIAAGALGRAPRLFTEQPLDVIYRERFPAAPARMRMRAERIFAHEIELFGRSFKLSPSLDWHRDPVSLRRFDAHRPADELAAGLGGMAADPKPLWELARGGHLVELAAAARLLPDLRERARAYFANEVDGFWEQNRVGWGIHYASPLEVSVRAIQWLGALELLGGARTFGAPFIERLAGGLAEDAAFLFTHLEDTALVPANHLLADYAGLLVLGLALEGTAPSHAWIRVARRGLFREAARQVAADGAHFEASTAYHRFALELLLTAHLMSQAAGFDLGVGEILHRMFAYVRGTLAPDGSEPGFGDSDDARVLAICPRPPHEHDDLLSIGVALFADPALRRSGGILAEEAVWRLGPEAAIAWDWVPAAPDLPAASFPSGGVHVLRSRAIYVALRSGSYGQHGVGGHAHNDQLALVVHARGRPLIVDAGTAVYGSDPVLRDRFRGTAAHATVVLDGAEQSPFLEGRPFALYDRARAAPVLLEDRGAAAEVVGAHHGYLRLRARALHRRRVVLFRDQEALLIEDAIAGRTEVSVEVRFPLAATARLGISEAGRGRAAALGKAFGILDVERAVELCELGRPRAALIPLFGTELEPHVEPCVRSRRYGATERASLVSYAGRLTLPCVTRLLLLVY